RALHRAAAGRRRHRTSWRPRNTRAHGLAQARGWRGFCPGPRYDRRNPLFRAERRRRRNRLPGESAEDTQHAALARPGPIADYESRVEQAGRVSDPPENRSPPYADRVRWAARNRRAAEAGMARPIGHARRLVWPHAAASSSPRTAIRLATTAAGRFHHRN